MTLDELRDVDNDLSAAMDNNSETSSPVTQILASIPGEHDGANYHWIVALENRTFAYITGGCDYTGWDCQSNLDIFEEPTLELVLRQVGEAYMGDLEAQLATLGLLTNEHGTVAP